MSDLHADMIAAVKHEIAEMEANGYDDFVGSPEARRVASMRAVLAHLERTQDLLTAARRAARSMEALIAELTDPGSEALAAKWELDKALSWLPPSPETPR